MKDRVCKFVIYFKGQESCFVDLIHAVVMGHKDIVYITFELFCKVCSFVRLQEGKSVGAVKKYM